MRWAPGWIMLKPEVLQKQVGKLTEEYGALFVEGTLKDGFIVPQVELVTGIKFLRFLKKENLAPSIPEVLYFFVKRAKSHPEAPRQEPQEQGSNFRLIFVKDRIHRFEWYYRCVKFLPASWKYILIRPRLVLVSDPSKECDPNVSVRRIEPSFRKERGGSSLSGIPSVWHPILFRDTEVFHVRILYIDLPRRFRTFPFGNIGQFAFVNPFRRNGSTFSAVPGRSCA